MTVDIQIPEVWENRTIHTFVQPDARVDGFASNISVAMHGDEEGDAKISLEDLVSQLPLDDTLDDLLVLERGYKSKGIIRYHERTYRFCEPMQGSLLQQRQRLVMVKRKPYVLTYTNVAKSFDDGVTAFNAVFDRLLATKG